MSDVVRLADVRADVDPRIVELLEAALVLAREGQLESVMYFGWGRDGSLWTGASESSDVWRDLAALERLKHQRLTMMDEG